MPADNTTYIKHNIPESQKTNEDYYYPVMDDYIRRSEFYGSYRSHLQVLYDAADGVVNAATYKYVLNPTNTQNDQLKGYPARLRNYPIIEPIIELFLGEFSTRDDEPVILNKAKGDNSFTRKRLEFMRRVFAQNFVNALNDAGMQTGVPSEEVPSPQEAFDGYGKSYSKEKAKMGEHALNVLRQDLMMDDKIQRLAWHWLVSGIVFTFSDINENDVEWEECDPRDITVFGLPSGGMAEDAEAVVYRRRMTRSQLNARLHLTDEEMDKLESEERDLPYNDHTVRELYTENIDNRYADERDNEYVNRDMGFNVYYVNWKGLKRTYILRYNDSITGQESEIEIEDTYQLDPEKGDIEKYYILEEVSYKGIRIEDYFYKDIGECPVQLNEINNTKTTKLMFNGKFRGYSHERINSIVKIGLNYQVLTNILHYRFELTLAKSKGKMIAFPFGLVPRQKGWDEEKWFYWGDANQILFYDESQPGAAAAIQGLKELDLSMGQYVSQMWEIIQMVKQEWWDTIGLNRQRYGNTFASDGKATAEQALMRSAIITEDMFRQFDHFLQREYERVIDYAKVAWIDGKRGWYLTPDKFRVFYEIDGVEFMNTQFGIYVSNSRTDKDNLKQAKELVLTMGQNGLGPDGMLKVLNARSMAKAEDIATKAMEIQRQHEQAMQRQQAETEAIKQQGENQRSQLESEDKRYVADVQANATIRAAEIRARVDLLGLMNSVYTDEQSLDEAGLQAVDNLQNVKAQIANEVNHLDVQRAREAASLKREQMATQIKVAKENKNRYDN